METFPVYFPLPPPFNQSTRPPKRFGIRLKQHLMFAKQSILLDKSIDLSLPSTGISVVSEVLETCNISIMGRKRGVINCKWDREAHHIL